MTQTSRLCLPYATVAFSMLSTLTIHVLNFAVIEIAYFKVIYSIIATMITQTDIIIIIKIITTSIVNIISR